MDLANYVIKMHGVQRVGPGLLAGYVVLDEYRDGTGFAVRRIARRGSPVVNAMKRAKLAFSAAKRSPEEDRVEDFLDRLARAHGELKRLADRTKNVLLRDVERRRSAWAQQKLRR